MGHLPIITNFDARVIKFPVLAVGEILNGVLYQKPVWITNSDWSHVGIDNYRKVVLKRNMWQKMRYSANLMWQKTSGKSAGFGGSTAEKRMSSDATAKQHAWISSDGEWPT